MSNPSLNHRGNNIPRKRWFRAGLMVMVLFAPALSLPLSATGQGPDDDRPFVSVDERFVGKAEFDDGGEAGTVATAVKGGFQWLGLEYARTDYSWSKKERLPFGDHSDDPWDTLHSLTLSSEHDGMFDHEWGWVAGVAVEAAYEDELSGSVGVDAYGGGIYVLNEDTRLLFGLAVSGHETGVGFLPLLMVDWDFVDESGTGWYAALGIPQTMLGYSFSNAFSLTLELGKEDGTYRLADDSKVLGKGYVGHEEMDISLSAAWKPWGNVTFTLGPCYRFSRSMTLYDKGGEEKESYDLDNALGGFVGLSITF